MIELVVYAFLGVSKGRLKWWVVLLMLAGVIGLGLLGLWIQHTVMWWIAGGGLFLFYVVLVIAASDDPGIDLGGLSSEANTVAESSNLNS